MANKIYIMVINKCISEINKYNMNIKMYKLYIKIKY